MLKDKLLNMFFLMVFATIGTAYANAQNLKKKEEAMKYKITITSKYFGRPDNRVIVSEDSLSYETKIYKGKNKKTARLLTEREKKSIEDFLKDFPISGLKESYVNNMVKDGTQMTFAMTINGKTKEIFIGNVYQENLGELVALIVPMLPEDIIQYRKELIYPY